ncbi:hypothetical protein SAMN04487869_110118 [Marinobacter sp. DSM 26671]|jgi:hypothetical protein|uniref:hypothetical protein n=1 Tax=Marinobacter sp. DSM 26671 TaxID=1761793 RepID=UPI0008F1ECCF|nr:hypothetical protein [Marinobacter sp. DSM 26671]SFE57529.1 hypothetical protein SAMN04487869_110118 [Marinobacter sp. DSM 26671]
MADLQTKIIQNVQSAASCVYRADDFCDLADRDEIERALVQLVELNVLWPIGEGLLARVRTNRLTNQLMLDAPGGFEQVAHEALDRLGIEWFPGTASAAYQQGSSQIPANASVRVVGEFQPKIAFKNYRIIYE